jgi:hypothetical protein
MREVKMCGAGVWDNLEKKDEARGVPKRISYSNSRTVLIKEVKNGNHTC